MNIQFVLAIVFSYLLGSVNFAVLVSRVMGLRDPRGYGSKNPGTTNVLRSGNKWAAISTLFFDGLKGWLPVFFLMHAGVDYGFSPVTAAFAGMAAFLGHVFPVFLGFRGGKGVATFLGVVLAVAPVLGLATLCIWILFAYFFHYSSLASLGAAFFVPVFYGLSSGVGSSAYLEQILVFILMTLVLAIKHRANILRLLRGTETRITFQKSSK